VGSIGRFVLGRLLLHAARFLAALGNLLVASLVLALSAGTVVLVCQVLIEDFLLVWVVVWTVAGLLLLTYSSSRS
jgi:hypothetical protein